METLVGGDRSLFLFLNGLHASWLDPLMGWISGTWTWLPLYGVLLFLVWKEGGWRRLVAYLVCVGLVVLLADRISVVAFKDVVQRLRPSHDPLLAGSVYLPTGYRGGLYGFVSSHAANVWGVALLSLLWLRRGWVTWLLCLWAMLVCYSRIYLGLHYPGDLLCGGLLGAGVASGVWLLAGYFGPRWRGKEERGQGARRVLTRSRLLLFWLGCPLWGAAQWTPYYPTDSTARCVSLTLTGDIMQHLPQIEAAERVGGYDYAPCFTYIAPYLRQSDITIGNLELTLGGTPYRGYPCFSAPDTLVYALRAAGFSAVTTANNHTCDRQTAGIRRTITVLERAGMPFTGTFRNAAERDSLTPRVIEKNGLRVGLLAYTYGTNGIPFAKPVVVNLIDTAQMAADLAKARQCTDFVVVAMHWGIEYQDAPSAEQRRLAEFLLAHGATLVVGNHPHVIQPLQPVRDSAGVLRQLCIYSMGNFISAQRTFPRAGAMLVHVVVEKSARGITLHEPQYLLTYVEHPVIAGKKNFRVLPLEGQRLDAEGYAKRFVDHAGKILYRTRNEIMGVHLRTLPYLPPREEFPRVRLKSLVYPEGCRGIPFL